KVLSALLRDNFYSLSQFSLAVKLFFIFFKFFLELFVSRFAATELYTSMSISNCQYLFYIFLQVFFATIVFGKKR
ncbi:hypothetical protein D3Z36_01420, partial [Lachnospiraceae bacterium]|nr:hypothetical protein [Lachnospiraceae bacterium]